MDLSFGSLFSALLISTLGAGFLMYGRKAERPIYALAGLAMCIYPYFIANPMILWPVTALVVLPLYVYRHSI